MQQPATQSGKRLRIDPGGSGIPNDDKSDKLWDAPPPSNGNQEVSIYSGSLLTLMCHHYWKREHPKKNCTYISLVIFAL